MVAPAGLTPSGGGASDPLVYQPGSPGYIEPTGSDSRGGKRVGYTDPKTGITYGDPAKLTACPGCTSGDQETNQDSSDPDVNSSGDDGTGGSDGTSGGTGSTGNSN